MSYSKLSRYNLSDHDALYFVDFYEWIRTGQTNIEWSAITIEAAEVDRLDLISQRFYNTSTLWWLVAVAANLDNPATGRIEAGTILRLPALQEIRSKLKD